MNRRHFLASTARAAAASAWFPDRLAAASWPAVSTSDTSRFAFPEKPKPVVKPGEFVFAAAHLDHGHITAMSIALAEAGATLKWVYEPDERKHGMLRRRHPQAKVAYSHQFEQFLTYAGATDATVAHASIGNFANPDYPEFEDFGEATLVGNNGAVNQVRVDWFTPNGLGTWGDGRTFILGTKGYIELRKYIDVGRAKSTDHVYLADERGEYHLEVSGKIGFRFFGAMILDCLERTEKAMTQVHVFKAAELAVRAQDAARRLTS